MNIHTKEEARPHRLGQKLLGKKVVFTNGCFDILHIGHIRLLQAARKLGDYLIIGLNSDASIKRYKGSNRPIIPQEERAEMLLALHCVDDVVIFDEDEPLELIKFLLPDILVKGADWAHYVSGRDVVEANGGKVVLIELEKGKSTTNIIEKIKDDNKVTQEILVSSRPSDDDPFHWAENINAMLKYGYCKKCGLTPEGCKREGCVK